MCTATTKAAGANATEVGAEACIRRRTTRRKRRAVPGKGFDVLAPYENVR